MCDDRTVAEMASEVLLRQAKARSDRSAEPIEGAMVAAPGARGRLGLWAGMVLAKTVPGRCFPPSRAPSRQPSPPGPTPWLSPDLAAGGRGGLGAATAVDGRGAGGDGRVDRRGPQPVGTPRGPGTTKVGGALQRRDRADGERGGASCLRHLETTIKHPVGFGEYLTLAWLGTSLATVVGAPGASLEE